MDDVDGLSGAAFLIARFGPQAPVRAALFRARLIADRDAEGANQLPRVQSVIDQLIARAVARAPEPAAASV